MNDAVGLSLKQVLELVLLSIKQGKIENAERVLVEVIMQLDGK